jgi:hypothetical protein
MKMNWVGLIKSVIVIIAMLVVFLLLMNTKWKDKFQEYPFIAIGIIILGFCVIGIIARIILGV